MKKILLTAGLACLLSGCWTTQEGQKTGLLVKIAKEGAIWGTYEGELIRGGLDNGSGANGQSFHFSLGQTKNNNVKRALELMDKNKPVMISYHCEKFVAPWRAEHKCFLDKVDTHD